MSNIPKSSPNKPKAIEHISDTARWVAVYRAAESERPDALFNDRFAGLLAGPHGADIVKSIPGGAVMGWAIVVRTQVIDEVILRAVADGVDTVLNLASGLDTRPYRLALPASLKWIEVDLPEISAYKKTKLAQEKPVCQLERINLDLSDGEKRRALFTRINGEAKKVLVLTEGILMYLPPNLVSELAADLRTQPTFAYWVQDYVAPAMLRILSVLWKGALGRGNSHFKFFNKEGKRFFTNRGWKIKEFHPSLHDARRLNRDMPFGWAARAADAVSPVHFGRKSGGILVLS